MSPPPPVEPALTLRLATAADIEWLVNLRLVTMSDYLLAAHEQLSLDDQRARVLQDFDAIRIIQVNTVDRGMIKLLKEQEAWTIVQIQMQPEVQGLGIGDRVLTDVINEASGMGVSLCLSVLKVNPAKRLYDRLGFVVTAEKTHSYEMRIN